MAICCKNSILDDSSSTVCAVASFMDDSSKRRRRLEANSRSGIRIPDAAPVIYSGHRTHDTSSPAGRTAGHAKNAKNLDQLVLPPSTVTQAARSSFPPGAVENRPGPAPVIAPMLTNINEDGD